MFNRGYNILVLIFVGLVLGVISDWPITVSAYLVMRLIAAFILFGTIGRILDDVRLQRSSANRTIALCAVMTLAAMVFIVLGLMHQRGFIVGE